MKYLLVIFIFANSLHAIEGVYEVIIKKQMQKEAKRWTLADWLLTKKKIAIQDQWLALHSSETLFEFMADTTLSSEIDHYVSSTGQTTKKDLTRYSGALYLRSLGVEYQKLEVGDDTKSTDIALNLIIWGSSLQSTHIRGFYGKRDYEWGNYSKYDQNFYGFAGSIYLAGFLGVDASWRKYADTVGENNVYNMRGRRVEYAGFLDMFFLRLRAALYKEKLFFDGVSSSTNQVVRDDEGVLFSAQLFL